MTVQLSDPVGFLRLIGLPVGLMGLTLYGMLARSDRVIRVYERESADGNKTRVLLKKKSSEGPIPMDDQPLQLL